MDPVDRLYWRLVEVLCKDGADPAARPLTIAEVYQQLIPYRQVRSELGIHELAAYEHALLRLLAGERGHVLVNSAAVREELERELASPNPILGIYRDYAAEGLWLNPAPRGSAPARPDDSESVPAATETPEAVSSAPEIALSPPLSAPVVTRVPPPPPPSCRSCRMHLPPGRDARFCPFCGAIQGPVPCKECGVDVEPEWSYCIGCGVPRTVPGKRH